MTEYQDVRRVQIDVSVIDPRGDQLSSVPGLPRDAFLLRVDHQPLSPELLARVEFDEICSHRPPAAAKTDGTRDAALDADDLLADERPAMIVFADLNFLDARMRHATAEAIEELAELAGKRPLRVKVVAYHRRVQSLTSEFTSDPDTIRAAAKALLGIAAQGPPMGTRIAGWRYLPAEGQRPAAITPDPLETEGPPDPEAARSAFELAGPGFQLYDASGEPRFTQSLPQRLAQQDVDPLPSLAALEAVMLSHAALPGRKALLLFTSSWFDLPDELWLRDLRGPLRAAQGGYTIWPIDARGLAGGPRDHSSHLLGYISASTGGEFVRASGRLALGIERALAQLSCYYLFSIPLPQPAQGERDIAIDVRLDTRRYPDFWYYRVRSASDVTLLARDREKQQVRLAALMEPSAHRFPEVRLTATYPEGTPPTSVVEVGTVLSDLTFTPGREGHAARLALEGAVVDEKGRTVCRLGDGIERTIRAEQQPARFPPSLLVLRSRCAFDTPGRYEIRAVVEDLVSGDVGAGALMLDVSAAGPGLAPLSGLRLGRSSGRDFVQELAPRAAGGAAPTGIARDAARTVFVPLLEDEPVVPDDRVLVRFVACSDWAPAVAAHPAEGAPVPFEVRPLGPPTKESAACREYQGTLPEGTLAPGSYSIKVRRGAGGPALAEVGLTVLPPETRPAANPGQKT